MKPYTIHLGFVLCLCIIACSEPMPNTSEDRAFLELSDMVFRMGATEHLTGSCDFIFECDCCSGHLILLADRTACMASYCLDVDSYSDGNYSVHADTLRLTFPGACRLKEYNWEYEADSTVAPWTLRDTTVARHELMMRFVWCGNTLKLLPTGVGELGLATSHNADSLFKTTFRLE